MHRVVATDALPTCVRACVFLCGYVAVAMLALLAWPFRVDDAVATALVGVSFPGLCCREVRSDAENRGAVHLPRQTHFHRPIPRVVWYAGLWRVAVCWTVL